MGATIEEDDGFTAELASRKAELSRSFVPRTSPACRAVFCGPGCALNPGFFTHEAVLTGCDPEGGSITIASAAANGALVGGSLRWIDGPLAGSTVLIRAEAPDGVIFVAPAPERTLPAGLRAIVREGCDHTLDTCADRFANAVNFRGEPFLPGNDLLARYPVPAS
jgi:uncharacterized phage protein (TIGR02218 family)